MNRETVFTVNAPEAIGPYEQAVKAGGFIFTSGQIAIDPSTNKFIEGDIEEQTKRVMANLKSVLEAGGSSMANVVKAVIYMTNLDDFEVVNRVFGKCFDKNRPARSTVQVSRLPKGALVEIDLIALL